MGDVVSYRQGFGVSLIQLDRVAETIREVASEVVLPAFRNLAADDVREKKPGDLVTIVDEQVEAALAIRLPALLPGSVLIGEESAHRNPAILGGLGGEYVWLIDPLDGTGNFVKGSPHFAIMVALLKRGQAVASWIYAPIGGDLVMAEQGGGVFYQNVHLPDSAQQRVTLTRGALPADLSGVVYSRYMPEEVRQWILSRADGSFRRHRPHGAAAAEYPRLLRNDVDFLLYWRTLPWDHVPGVLMVNEAGGRAQRPDGRAYTALDQGAGLVVAADDEVWQQVIRRLEIEHLIGPGKT